MEGPAALNLDSVLSFEDWMRSGSHRRPMGDGLMPIRWACGPGRLEIGDISKNLKQLRIQSLSPHQNRKSLEVLGPLLFHSFHNLLDVPISFSCITNHHNQSSFICISFYSCLLF